MSDISNRMPSVADIMYGSYIRYDRLFEMTKYAFYGKTDSNDVNVFIDLYSIFKNLYTRGTGITINDSYVIASCSINLAIHLRAYFDTRHKTSSKIYLIYGGARPISAMTEFPQYNGKNIIMEESNQYMKKLIIDNLEVIRIMVPYLHDIFAVVDYANEFSTITASIIRKTASECQNTVPNIIYSKDDLTYQLVAFCPRTFLYRPKKANNQDVSWVVTKSTLYDAYRYGQLGLKKQFVTSLNVQAFSVYQAIAGVKSRNIGSTKNGNTTVKLLENAIQNGLFNNGFNLSMDMCAPILSPFSKMFDGTDVHAVELIQKFRAIDLNYQTMMYDASPSSINAFEGLINLYNPQEIRNINDRYFTMYPLDLNRV